VWTAGIDPPFTELLFEKTKWKYYMKGSSTFNVGTYTVPGTPDIDRIIHETLEQGALAIKVECTETFRLQDGCCYTYDNRGCYIWSTEIGDLGDGWKFENKDYFGWHLPGGEYNRKTDADIESAIRDYMEKQKTLPPVACLDVVAKHYELTSEDVQAAIKGYKDGKKKQPTGVGKNIVVGEDGNQYELGTSGGEYKQSPTHKVGDIVVCGGRICEIFRIKPRNNSDIVVIFKDKKFEHTTPRAIRPATPDEIDEWYTVEIDGVRVRAYECVSGKTRLYFGYNGSYGEFIEDYVLRGLLKNSNIPIMPYSQSNGNYKPPKGS
jgi:hypothetical protein